MQIDNQGWYCPGCKGYHPPSLTRCDGHHNSVDQYKPNDYYQNNKKCLNCGINLNGVMGYVCNKLDCPTGLGPTVCYNTKEFLVE